MNRGLPLALALLLGGCSLSKPYPSKRFFYADVERGGEQPELGRHVLRVETFEIAPAFAGKSLVSRVSEEEYVADYYAEFFSAPDTMVTSELRQWLDDGGVFQAVLGPGSVMNVDRLLEGTIDQFYLDLREPGVPRAVLSFYSRLIDDSGPEPEVIFNRRYSSSIPLTSTKPEDAVVGWTQGLKQMFADLEMDLSKRL